MEIEDCRMNKQILSICIPTFNRANILKLLLNDLIEKVGKYNITICVSDNASTDETENVVREAVSRYSNIIYSRNDTNIGFDRNIEKVLRMSNSQFSWLLGDDDEVVGNFEEILELLSSETVDLISLNPQLGVNGDLTTQEDKDKLLEEAWKLTWISTLIFNKTLIGTNNIDFERFYESGFMQIGIIFENASKKKLTILSVSQSIVVPRAIKNHELTEHYGGKLNVEIFSNSWTKLIFSLPHKYSLESKLKAIKNYSINTRTLSLNTLCSLRSKNYYNAEIYSRNKETLIFASQVPKVLLFLISVFPISIMTMLRKIKNCFLKTKGEEK